MSSFSWSLFLFCVSWAFLALPEGSHAQPDCTSFGGQNFKLFVNPTWTGGKNDRDKWAVGSYTEIAQYCIAAHLDCSNSGANCPLYINTENFNLGSRVTAGDKFIFMDVSSDWNSQVIGEGNPIKHVFASLPRIAALQFPGLDKSRVFVLGFGAGGGGNQRGLCSGSKGFDHSPIGPTSNVYAGVVASGGCGLCGDNQWGRSPLYSTNDTNWLQGLFHVLATNGEQDSLAGGSCYDTLSKAAITAGCNQLSNFWCNVPSGDAIINNAGLDGSNKAQTISFGTCQGGDVLGYKFRDEGHVVSYDINFTPKVSMNDVAWNWLSQGRSKTQSVTITRACTATTTAPSTNGYSYSRASWDSSGFDFKNSAYIPQVQATSADVPAVPALPPVLTGCTTCTDGSDGSDGNNNGGSSSASHLSSFLF